MSVNRRVEEREIQVELMLDQLKNGNAAERREAAYYLGEAASENAVDPLIEAYHEDPDRDVRQAAAYALGMFRAVDQALHEGRDEQVRALLRRVEEQGKLGRRSPVGRWTRINLALILSLAGLAALFWFAPDVQSLLFAGGARARATVVRDVRAWFDAVKTDITTLQGQFVNVLMSGGEVDCTLFFNDPAPYVLPSADARAYRDLGALVNDLNRAQASLATAKRRFNDTCFGSNPLTRDNVTEPYSALTPTIEDIPALDAALAEAAGRDLPTPAPSNTVVPAAAPTESSAPVIVPTSAPVETTIPTTAPSATPAVEEVDFRRHLPTLYNLIDNVTSARGASTLLLQYWEDVARSGDSDGCNVGAPDVPPDYGDVTDADKAASPSLARALDLINSGLSDLRRGQTEFTFGCNSRDLRAYLDAGWSYAQSAAESFSEALDLLDYVRDGGR